MFAIETLCALNAKTPKMVRVLGLTPHPDLKIREGEQVEVVLATVPGEKSEAFLHRVGRKTGEKRRIRLPTATISVLPLKDPEKTELVLLSELKGVRLFYLCFARPGMR